MNEISKFITNFSGSKNFPIENKRGTRLISCWREEEEEMVGGLS